LGSGCLGLGLVLFRGGFDDLGLVEEVECRGGEDGIFINVFYEVVFVRS
jgi:hypothetical protein